MQGVWRIPATGCPGQASTGFTDDGHELSAYFTIRAGPHWRITPEAIYGLSDGSPDYGGAIMLSYQF